MSATPYFWAVQFFEGRMEPSFRFWNGGGPVQSPLPLMARWCRTRFWHPGLTAARRALLLSSCRQVEREAPHYGRQPEPAPEPEAPIRHRRCAYCLTLQPDTLPAEHGQICAGCLAVLEPAPVDLAAGCDHEPIQHAPDGSEENEAPAGGDGARRARLEAKLEKRAEWAGGRRAKAAALHARNEPYHGDYAFNTQPGHIPERARVIRRTDKACEHQAVAQHHDEKAAGLARQLDRSIFSDDTDAVAAIKARIAEREAERARIAAYNASCRKAAKAGKACGDLTLLDETQKAELSTLLRVCSYQVREGGAFPAYVSSNLSGRIKADRDRLVEIERRAKQAGEVEAAGGMLIHRSDGGEYCTVTFAEKPERDVLDALRAAGFRFGAGSWGGRTERLPAIVAEMEAGDGTTRAMPSEPAPELEAPGRQPFVLQYYRPAGSYARWFQFHPHAEAAAEHFRRLLDREYPDGHGGTTATFLGVKAFWHPELPELESFYGLRTNRPYVCVRTRNLAWERVFEAAQPERTTAQLRTAAWDAEQAKRYAEAAELYELAAERYPGDASWISSALQRDDIAGLRRMAAFCRRMVALEAKGEPPIWETFEHEPAGTVDRICAAQVDAAPGPSAPASFWQPALPEIVVTGWVLGYDDARQRSGEPLCRISRLEAAAERFHDAGAFLRRLSVVLVLLGLLAPALAHAAPAKPVHHRPACEEVKPGVWARPTKHGWSTTPCETEITFRETSRARFVTVHKATPTACEVWLPAGYLTADARLAQRLEAAEQMCIDDMHAAAEKAVQP